MRAFCFRGLSCLFYAIFRLIDFPSDPFNLFSSKTWGAGKAGMAFSDASEYLFSDQVVQTLSMGKYFSVRFDAKLSFICYIEHVKKKLSKQCGIVSKKRHFVPRSQLISYFSSNVFPFIHYGVLVYGCYSYSSLLPLFMLQKEVLKFISFRRKSDSCSDLFLKNGFLSVYELHIYELPKFVLISAGNFHSDGYCNEMFQFN